MVFRENVRYIFEYSVFTAILFLVFSNERIACGRAESRYSAKKLTLPIQATVVILVRTKHGNCLTNLLADDIIINPIYVSVRDLYLPF